MGAVGSVTNVLRVGSAIHRPAEPSTLLRAVRVRAAMKPVPDGIAASATLEEAEDRMDRDGVNWLPVVDEQGRLVGLITRLDLRQAQAPRSFTSSRAR
ncbi:MAG: CBS domain-containing protein [Thermoplasmata archaeon]|nr:CBS domain-containing protein [Thermoplasmata archaeon]